jgi:hypothetical protein
MRLIWLAFASAPLLGVMACQGFPFPWKTEPAPAHVRHEETSASGAEDIPRARVELQDIRYDGWVLSGRILVSPEEGRLRLDKRLIESVSLSMKSVTDCVTGQPVEFMVLDVFAKPPREEDVLLLAPGYWHGKDIRLPLFAEIAGRPQGPECIEADLVFYALGGKTAGQLHVRAERSQPLPVDAGLPTDAGLPRDAGL